VTAPGAHPGAPRRPRRHSGPGRVSVHLCLLVLCGIWALPVLALFVSSFRDPYAIANSGWWTVLSSPTGLTVENYRRVIVDSGMGRAFVNSLLVTVPAVTMMTCVGTVSSYALARIRFRGSRLLLALLLALLVIPVQMTLVPVLRLYNHAHL